MGWGSWACWCRALAWTAWGLERHSGTSRSGCWSWEEFCSGQRASRPSFPSLGWPTWQSGSSGTRASPRLCPGGSLERHSLSAGLLDSLSCWEGVCWTGLPAGPRLPWLLATMQWQKRSLTVYIWRWKPLSWNSNSEAVRGVSSSDDLVGLPGYTVTHSLCFLFSKMHFPLLFLKLLFLSKVVNDFLPLWGQNHSRLNSHHTHYWGWVFSILKWIQWLHRTGQ